MQTDTEIIQLDTPSAKAQAMVRQMQTVTPAQLVQLAPADQRRLHRALYAQAVADGTIRELKTAVQEFGTPQPNTRVWQPSLFGLRLEATLTAGFDLIVKVNDQVVCDDQLKQQGQVIFAPEQWILTMLEAAELARYVALMERQRADKAQRLAGVQTLKPKM
jgi:hypothetical protein